MHRANELDPEDQYEDGFEDEEEAALSQEEGDDPLSLIRRSPEDGYDDRMLQEGSGDDMEEHWHGFLGKDQHVPVRDADDIGSFEEEEEKGEENMSGEPQYNEIYVWGGKQ